ncbi:hypothetical protein ASG42_28505 [Rhizobium sp. Leaf391]|nr:hypothetical protein ASG42_28505 [Rhizobium sp. Leaf391]
MKAFRDSRTELSIATQISILRLRKVTELNDDTRAQQAIEETEKGKVPFEVRSYQPRVLTPPNVLPTRARRLERERFQTAKTKAYRQAAASARRSAALLQGAT